MKRKELERVQQMFGVKKKGVLKDRTNNATKRKASTTTKSKKKRKVTFSDQEEERVRVVVRVRPQISEDLEHCLEEDAPINCVRTMSSKKRIAIQRPLYDEKIYGFDEVLSPSTTQEQTYQVVGKGAVQAVMEGFNGTVLCYGQTGSGKTYTTFGHARFWDKVMENETFASLDENAGILPRAYFDVFQRVNEMRKKGLEVTLRFSALQIYQEQLLDLLHVARTTSSSSGSRPARPDFDNLMTASKHRVKIDPTTQDAMLNIRECKHTGVYVEGLRWQRVENLQELLQVTAFINERRSTRNTMQNRTSSRSHCVIQLSVDTINGRGVLKIVDLAGSERVGKSMSKGESLKEAIKINQSISALGNCVSALASGRSGKNHVPYRDSKLTRLLTDTLSGNSKSWICTNVAPITAHCEETISTLHFATRAMRVKINATINERSIVGGMAGDDDDDEVIRLREEVQELRKRLETWDDVMKRNAHLEIENARLRKVLEQTSDRAAKNYLKRFDEMSGSCGVEGKVEEQETY